MDKEMGFTMREKACGACLLMILLLLAAGAMAETYAYGGSGSDCLEDIAISEDGRILMTGYTSSTDGTLASRTKSGRSGWALCVDARGDVLWSFCSRNGSEDEMCAPVFHDDGTATVLLFSRDSEKEQVELIRLDASGKEAGRVPLAENADTEDKSLMTLSPHAFAGGYMIGTQDIRNWANTYAAYDWNGQAMGTPGEFPEGNGIMVMSEAHAIMGMDKEIWLCALAKDGTRTLLAKLDDHKNGEMLNRRYNGLVSLEDGGAAACGWIKMDEQRKGLFSRWDAEGKTVFEWVMDDVQLNDLIALDGGFVTYAFPDYSFQNMPKTLRLTLMRFDAEGIVGTRAALPEIPYGGSCRLAALPDGRIAAQEAWWSDEGRMKTALVIHAL